MILNHDYRFIFIANGRTGTSSIENALAPFHQGQELQFRGKGLFNPKHMPPVIVRALLPPSQWDSYFKFVFVRNPWDWFVSQWFHNTRPAPIELNRISTLRRRVPREFEKWTFRSAVRRNGRFSVEHVDWIYRLLWKHRGLPQAKSLFQTTYVHDVSGQQILDFVGRYESLEEDFDVVCRQIGISRELPRINVSSRSRGHDYFDERARDRVGELWRCDVEAFGYDPPNRSRSEGPDTRDGVAA